MPDAHNIVKNVLASDGCTFVQLTLHPALFRRRTWKFAELFAAYALAIFPVVVAILSASGRRRLPLPVGRPVAAGSMVPAQGDTGPPDLAFARRESRCALPTVSGPGLAVLAAPPAWLFVPAACCVVAFV
jgi:hypothetical protein